jgi:protein-tyrosine phosphatase
MLREPSIVLFLCSGNYYRSRFAELLFNHLVTDTALVYRAESAGLLPNCRTHNTGWISEHTVEALRAREVAVPSLHRIPRDVTEAEIRGAALTIALKEVEHRPMVLERFPGLLERIEFWQVHDVQDAPPSEAIALIENNVKALIERLTRLSE